MQKLLKTLKTLDYVALLIEDENRLNYKASLF